MATKLTARGATTKAKILDTASAIIEANGVAGLTIDRVCATAAVSKSQLYHYFDSRDSLLQAIAATTVDEVLSLQLELFAELTSLEGFRRWVAALVNLQVERAGAGGCPIGSLHNQLDETQVRAHKILRDGFEHWEAAILKGLQAMQRSGELPATCNVAEQAKLFLVAIQGGLLLTDAFRDPTWLARALDERLQALAALTSLRLSK